MKPQLFKLFDIISPMSFSQTTKMVLLYYANRANKASCAYPSVETIARQINASKSQVEKSRALLIKRGILRKDHTHKRAGCYEIVWGNICPSLVEYSDDENRNICELDSQNLPNEIAESAIENSNICDSTSQNLRLEVAESAISKTCIRKNQNNEPVQESVHEPVQCKRVRKSKFSKVEVGEYFSRFWELYPRKISKQVARRKFESIIATTDPEIIIAAVGKQRETTWAGKIGTPEEKFIKHPSTWLHAGSWEDEVSNENGTYTGKYEF
ncbi:MAG: helix-turn-helix domain-containing protein [Phycisphaerales bacterium]|jgi:hypothetical protein|nr:helix-turn-helix domain-containing protein [Phycisphaerales bacterium]MBT7171871.1 helix-turn-helix domain-containing protein [Phycisphaerales bacterium]